MVDYLVGSSTGCMSYTHSRDVQAMPIAQSTPEQTGTVKLSVNVPCVKHLKEKCLHCLIFVNKEPLKYVCLFVRLKIRK